MSQSDRVSLTLQERQRVQQFIDRWQGSQGNERANYQGFFLELCDALGVDRPPPKGNVAGDPYCFDKDIRVIHKDGFSTNYADFYKEGHFLIEAKQGGSASNKGTAKRGTKTYDTAMEKAFYQALSYTPFLLTKPPFVITCDIGSHFELWTSFSGNYGGYGARETIGLEKLLDEKVFRRFVAIFTDPQSLNPEKYRARVTREVADTLAKLARWLEEQGNEPQEVANFLMRCIFTMFAEDVDLLKGEVFTRALRERWIAYPPHFKPEIEALWQTMNTGGSFGFERILQFNGSFFAHATAFDLPKPQLEVLYEAAAKDWSAVEPAIFGTLLERALDRKERSRLGAHYTPRSYVERLVRPVVMEPLREEWLLVESEIDRLLMLKLNQPEPTKAQRQKAAAEIEGFLAKLQQMRILDPACGTGNFLYVTLDLLKTLEQEVQTRLLDVVGQVTTDLLEEFDPRLAGRKQVNPSQFLGIEINPRAAAIAELVIWIGYLQWHFKRYGSTPPPEPILQDFHNIEFRDAVLDYDGRELDVDPKTGKVRTRWGGRMIKHPVTGENVPDPSDQVPIYRYLNPRPAEWPEADYIIGNPPFIGNKRMKSALGEGYVEALRRTWKDVPESADFVMYWWHKAASFIGKGQANSFGLITTNSLTQSFNKRVVESHLRANGSLIFAIPDHPWVDSDNGAQVRVAMTAFTGNSQSGRLIEVIHEVETEEGRHSIEVKESFGKINSDLSVGVDLSNLQKLLANQGLACPGVQLSGQGFVLSPPEVSSFSEQTRIDLIRSYLTGRDLTQAPRSQFVIDTFGLSETELRSKYPDAYQRILERVKPERDHSSQVEYARKWWLHSKPRPKFRETFVGLKRFIVTSRTARHRVFQFISTNILPETKVLIFSLDDAALFGVLSSRVHIIFANANGGWLGVGNDSTYNHSICFDTFPFPDPTSEQKQKIRELGERLDAHRKRVQAQHPDVTITGMYNLLEKLRNGEAFTDSDRAYNDRALVSTLKQIHDELDEAVLEAYGWGDLVNSPSSPPLPLTPTPTGGAGGPEGAGEPGKAASSHFPDLPSPALGEGPGEREIWEISPAVRAKMTEVAREFRKQPTASEATLWQALRRKQLDGRKFRRQQPIGPFVVDFFCAAERLIVEVDGGIHEFQQERDRDRQGLLESLGLRFIRVKSVQVETNLSAVLSLIQQAFTEENPPLPPAPTPTRGAGGPGRAESPHFPDLPSPALGEGPGERANLNEVILERLVALNAERAEAERNGLIRWLRPEYQAPEQVQPQQQLLPGVVEPEETAVAAVEQNAFPKQPKEQLAAIRDLLRTRGGEWTIEQIAAQFKGRTTQKKLDDIAENLERLEWFGLVICREPGVKRWQFAEMSQTLMR